MWAVTRNISVFLCYQVFGRVHVVVIYSRPILTLSDPHAVWSVLSLILCWFHLVFFSLSATLFRLSLLTSSGDVIVSHKHTYWSQPRVSHPVLALSQGQRALYNAEFTAVWCLSFVEYTLFHWGSNWELKNTVLSPPNKLNLVLTHYQGELYFYHPPHCFVGIFVFKGHGLIKGTTKECSWTCCQNPLDLSHTAL